MIVNEKILLKEGVNTPFEISPNETGCDLEIEISGAITINGHFEAKIDSLWAKVAAFNYSNITFQPEFTANGLFSIGIMGFSSIRIVVDSYSGSPIIIGRVIR